MKIGLEILATQPAILKEIGKFALLTNQASVNGAFRPSWSVLFEMCPSQMVALMGPQHGFESTVQDNMIETGHAIHGPTGLPVYSLYSETREPTAQMLSGVDAIVIDMQISGTRIYTYKYTIAACLRAAKKFNKKVLVLDRPNPLGGVVIEGNTLEMSARSFVGEFPIPMRHGMTAAEAAVFFNLEIGADLEVVWMIDWQPEKMWHELGRPWILTSPNLPTAESAFVYPGMVIFEGTNISEGRGTTRPFQFVGAPSVRDGDIFKARVIEILGMEPRGLFLRPTTFQPTFHKWQSQVCHGLDLIVTDPILIRSFPLALAILRAGMELMGEDFKWAQPPYEYNDKDLPIDLILGSLNAHKYLEAPNFNVNDPVWTKGTDLYLSKIHDVLHYDRDLILG